MWSRRAVRPTFPGVPADAVEHLARQRHRVPPGGGVDARRLARANAMNELLQLARQLVGLVALAAVHLDDLHMPGEQLRLEAGQQGGSSRRESIRPRRRCSPGCISVSFRFAKSTPA